MSNEYLSYYRRYVEPGLGEETCNFRLSTSLARWAIPADENGVAQETLRAWRRDLQFSISKTCRPTLRTPCGEERLARTSERPIFEANNYRPTLRTPLGEERLARAKSRGPSLVRRQRFLKIRSQFPNLFWNQHTTFLFAISAY